MLTDVGAFGAEGRPTLTMPFYRLNSATVRQAVSAFMVITVIGKGAPTIGATEGP